MLVLYEVSGKGSREKAYACSSDCEYTFYASLAEKNISQIELAGRELKKDTSK